MDVTNSLQNHKFPELKYISNWIFSNPQPRQPLVMVIAVQADSNSIWQPIKQSNGFPGNTEPDLSAPTGHMLDVSRYMP